MCDRREDLPLEPKERIGRLLIDTVEAELQAKIRLNRLITDPAWLAQRPKSTRSNQPIGRRPGPTSQEPSSRG